MLDIGWAEMAVIVVVTLLVVGPKDLPKVLRTVRYWIGKARGMAREFQDGLDDLVREAELKELKIEVEDATRDQLSGEFDDIIDPTGNIIGPPEDEVRAPDAKAARAADATGAEPTEAPAAPGAAPTAQQPPEKAARPKPAGDGDGAATKPASKTDGPAAPDGAEASSAQQTSRSKPAEPTPVQGGAASASGR